MSLSQGEDRECVDGALGQEDGVRFWLADPEAAAGFARPGGRAAEWSSVVSGDTVAFGAGWRSGLIATQEYDVTPAVGIQDIGVMDAVW